MVGSRPTSARESGQVRKEAALSGHRRAVRGRPAGVSEAESTRRPTSTAGARSIFSTGCAGPKHGQGEFADANSPVRSGYLTGQYAQRIHDRFPPWATKPVGIFA